MRRGLPGVSAIFAVLLSCAPGPASPHAGPQAVVEIPSPPPGSPSAPEPVTVDAGRPDVSVEKGGGLGIRGAGASAAAPAWQQPDAAPGPGGLLDKAAVLRVIRQNTKRFRFCYENVLRKQPTASGRLMLRFTIEPDGSVSQSTAAQPSGIAGLDHCIAGAMRSLRFPRSSTPTIVNYPFVFMAAGDGGAPTGRP